MEKLKMHSPNFADQNIEKLSMFFPGCVVESRNDTGELTKAIDFDLLKQELSKYIVEGPKERYQINWPGKKEALLNANAPITKTLRPCREESVDFDNTENLFIEGDNLEALKLVQETYLGKVKLIYIDPPYNTGTNLIYKNDYTIDANTFSKSSGDIGSDGQKLTANLITDGRFHSDWLSMIYSRIKLAKRLLADDGILICAIDENEFSNLSLIIKEIFGEGSYCHDYVSVVHNPRGQQGLNFSYVNEYLIYVYPKGNQKYLADFKKAEVDVRNLRDSGTESDRKDAKNCFYPFIINDGKIVGIGEVPEDSYHPKSSNIALPNGNIEIWPINEAGEEKKWRYARQSVEKIRQKLKPKLGRNSVQILFHKDMGTLRSVWMDPKYDSSEYGSKLIDKLVPGSGFTYPKSLWAVFDCVYSATHQAEDAIVMDFFAGSGTTAHAVMELNSRDNARRKFIMVQVAQECDEGSKPFRNGFKTIAEISKERIRRAGKKIKEENPNTSDLDIGFRVLKVDSSNMNEVHYTPDSVSKSDLFNQVEHIKNDRSGEDLLFQVMLDWGVDLSLPIRAESIADKTVYFVNDDDLVACFEEDIDEALIKALADYEPLRVVFRDDGFESDSVKINAEQIFKQLSPNTDIKSI